MDFRESNSNTEAYFIEAGNGLDLAFMAHEVQSGRR